MCKENKYIRFDWAVKHMLRDKANFGVLEGLITVFIGEPVKILEILESEGNQNRYDDKFNRVDIKAKTHKGHLIIVEVQLTRQIYYLQRILYGVAKAITEHISLGDSYEKVSKVYSINILYCDMGKGDDYVYRGTVNFKGIHTGDSLIITKKEQDILIDVLPESVFPEYFIIRVNEFDKIPENPLDEWVNYLKTGKINDCTETPGLQEAGEKLQYLNMTEEERLDYDRHLDSIMVQNDTFEVAKMEGREEGRAEGKAEGRAEGAYEKSLEIARILCKMGLSAEEVASASGLPIEVIINL